MLERREKMDKLQRLLELIREKALHIDGEYRLAYGGESGFFFDIKSVSLDPEGSNLIADIILDKIKDDNLEAVGGLESGAIPIVAAVTERSYQIERPLNGFFVRKKPKNRGTEELIEGNFKEKSKVILVDDVTTTGNSVVNAIDAVRKRGSTVDKVITIVDRSKGAKESLKEHNIELVPLIEVDNVTFPELSGKT
jgi:orotate phosphoribosyltransferase